MRFWDERLRYLTRYILQFKQRFFVTFFLTLAASGTLVLSNYSLTLLIERGFAGANQWNPNSFYLFLCCFIFLKVFGSILTYLSRQFSIHTASRITFAMQMDLYKHVLNLPISFFDTVPSGKIVSRVTHDISRLRSLYETVLVRFTHSILFILITFGLLLYRNWVIALFCLLPLLLLVLVTRFYVRHTSPLHREMSTTRSRITNQLQEQVKNLEVIQAFGKEQDALCNFQKDTRHFSDVRMKLLRYQSFANYTLNECVTVTTKIFILAGVGWIALYSSDPTLVATLFLFFTSMEEVLTAFTRITQNVQVLNESIVAAGQVCEILNHPEQVGIHVADPKWIEERNISKSARNSNLDSSDSTRSDRIQADIPYLVFDSLCFSYNPSAPVLKDFSYTLQKGESLALVGPTGCGKTTLLSLLMRFYEPQEGTIRYQGTEYRGFSQKEWRTHLGLVLQDPYLFSGTILENLTLNKPDLTEEQAVEALIRIGGAEFLQKLPQKIHTPVTQGGSTFSSGERQLLSFARALLQNPEILLLDEATSHIDTETEQIIQKGIETLKQNRTLILVAHRLSTIRNSDHILVLSDGAILESGNHESLMEANGKYAEYVRTSRNGFFAESDVEN